MARLPPGGQGWWKKLHEVDALATRKRENERGKTPNVAWSNSAISKRGWRWRRHGPAAGAWHRGLFCRSLGQDVGTTGLESQQPNQRANFNASVGKSFPATLAASHAGPSDLLCWNIRIAPPALSPVPLRPT
jgi:hypothetical protein